MDARMAWYSVGASSTQLDTTSSSYSLLHSIYGSQASQLPFSDYDSEVSLNATQSDYHMARPHPSPTLKRKLSRPKSSPASVLAAREQLRSPSTQSKPARPGSALSRQPRPGSAARRIARGRPASAAVGRPASAASAVRGGASPSRRRPKTAMGFQRSPSWVSGSSTMLLDLEEEDEGDEVAPIIRETPPVHLTSTPEYFDFWQGKPLREREYGVKTHKRKAWKRPRSDYGTRFITRGKENSGKDNDKGRGDDGGYGGLETLLEKDGDSSLSSRRGSRDFGTLGDGSKSGNNDDSSKLSVTGESLGSRRGSKDFGGNGSLRDRSSSRHRLKSGKQSDSDQDSKGRGQGLDSLARDHGNRSEWKDQDGADAANDDDYFRNSTNGSSKQGAGLPTISSANPMASVNLTALDTSHTHPLESMHQVEADNKENLKPLSKVGFQTKRERRAMKQLQAVDHLPPLSVTKDNNSQCSDYEPGRAMAAVSWMDGGLGSSSGNTTRFELPVDMKTLERMTPLDYLNTHCVISKRRLAHCSKIFTKLDKKKCGLHSEEVKVGLIQAHHNCITEEQASRVLDHVGMADETQVDLKLFAAICCFAERMLNLFFLPLARKEVIEVVDFEALDWKLRDCSIKDSLRTLFSNL